MTDVIMASQKPKVYALLVGIANYASEVRLAKGKVRFPKLYGCVSDVRKVKLYLEDDNDYEVKIETLIDDGASKEAIVNAFHKHLSKATERDVVLFYFSGHGTQEYIDNNVFKTETDGKSECIVCYYNEHTKDDFLLADKELRWLINSISSGNPHIITIFDCCHSAGVTRDPAIEESDFPQTVEKRVPFTFPKRDWQSYIFNHISENEMKEKGEDFILPEAAHIELTACESNEAAIEVQGEGVLTKALLKVLESCGGQISYRTLHNRIRQYLRGAYRQKPSVNHMPVAVSITSDNDPLLAGFLNKQNLTGSGMGEVVFNPAIGWLINVGAIHGLKSASVIPIFDPSQNNCICMANIAMVYTDHAVLRLINEAGLEKEKVYKADLRGLLSKIITVHIPSKNTLPKDQLNLLDELIPVLGENIELEDKEEEADYVLRCHDKSYYITLPNDEFRPLAEPVQVADDKPWINKIAEQLKHISTWTFIKEITNAEAGSQFENKAIAVNISTGDPLTLVEDSDNPRRIIIPLQQQNQKLVSKIKIEVVNNSKDDVFLSSVYITSNFQSFTGFLNPNVYRLEPNEKVVLRVGKNEELSIETPEMMRWYNWKKLEDRLKFIVSTEKFDVAGLSLSALPEPPVPAGAYEVKRGIVLDVPDEVPVYKWATFDVDLVFVNPHYDQISNESVQVMLENKDTAYFARGLYLTSKKDIKEGSLL